LVKEAKRIHFIGLAGHPLMRNSLRSIFQETWKAREDLASKKFFVATKHKDNTERVFRSICDCLLPEEWRKDDAWREKNLSVTECGSFEDWIDHRWHHEPIEH
jgi:hypothetical protein